MSFKQLSPKKAMLKDVHLYYVKIQSPATKWESTDLEYTVNALMTKEDAKAYKELFPKNGMQKLTKQEFESKFRSSVPYEADSYYVAKIKTAVTEYNVKGSKYAMKVYEKVGNKAVDITHDKLVGNGSVGDIAIYVNTTTKYGTFSKLEAVLVTDLVEYESSNNPFGLDSDADDNPFAESLTETPKEKPAKAAPKSKDSEDDWDF